MDEVAVKKKTNLGGESRGYTREPVQGGQALDLSKLLTGSLNDVMDNMGGYLILVLVKAAIYIPVVLCCVMLAYFLMFVVMFGGMLGGIVLSMSAGVAVGGDAGEGVLTLGILLTYFLVLLAIIPTMMLAMMPIMCLAPLNAGAMRAIAKHQRGEITLKGTEFLALSGKNALSMILVETAVFFCICVGLLFFYVGALVPLVLFIFAPGLVALHGMGWLEAMRTSARIVINKFQTLGVYALVYFAISMAAGYVPFLGAAFMYSLHTRAHRHVFGDDAELAQAA